MIHLEDVLTYKTYHKKSDSMPMSSLAICGYKYRHDKESDVGFKGSWEMDIGNALEYALKRKIAHIDDTYQYQAKISIDVGSIVANGKMDFFSLANKHIIEFKTTSSNGDYKDIYKRQTYAYMWGVWKKYCIDAHASIWIYHLNSGRWEILELDFDADEIQTVIDSISSYNLGYIKGIENSLCEYCSNIDCPMQGYKLHDDKITYVR